MALHLGLTGTPGTGKKSIAPLVASRLRLRACSLNALAESAQAISGDDVDVRALRRKLNFPKRARCLPYGHLLPYVLERDETEMVVVLRCDPVVLARRLRERGYPEAKVIENVEAEFIGVVSADSLAAFGRDKVAEYDTTRDSPVDAAAAVSGIFRGSVSTMPVDWVPHYDAPAKLRGLLAPGARRSP